MSEIDAQRKLLLEQINQDLKADLYSAFNNKSIYWVYPIKCTMTFYRSKRTPQQQRAFESYAQKWRNIRPFNKSLFEQLTIRDQYLIKHQGQSYVELFDAGERTSALPL